MRARRAGRLCAALIAVAVVGAVPCGAEQAAGRQIEVDPDTGRVLAPRDREAPPALPPSADMSTSDEGLVERAGTTPAGGVGVDLRGRFRASVQLRREADGSLVQDCVPGTAP